MSRQPDRRGVERRHPHSIRFTEFEWSRIQESAARHGLSPAEIVRARTLGLADKRFLKDPIGLLSPGHIAVIEATYRTVHLLATLATQPVRYDEVDDLLGAAHHALLKTLNKDPVGTVPGDALYEGLELPNEETGQVPDPRSGRF